MLVIYISLYISDIEITKHNMICCSCLLYTSPLQFPSSIMFGAVMMDEGNCKGLLERVLQIPIDRVEISKEKSIVYHPEYKGCLLYTSLEEMKNITICEPVVTIKSTLNETSRKELEALAEVLAH